MAGGGGGAIGTLIYNNNPEWLLGTLGPDAEARNRRRPTLGNTHDTAAARIWNILAALREAGLIALGDKGYHGYDPTGEHVITPYKGRNKPESQKDANRPHARL